MSLLDMITRAEFIFKKCASHRPRRGPCPRLRSRPPTVPSADEKCARRGPPRRRRRVRRRGRAPGAGAERPAVGLSRPSPPLLAGRYTREENRERLVGADAFTELCLEFASQVQGLLEARPASLSRVGASPPLVRSPRLPPFATPANLDQTL